jgi:hypothetical protein
MAGFHGLLTSDIRARQNFSFKEIDNLVSEIDNLVSWIDNLVFEMGFLVQEIDNQEPVRE